MERAARGSSPPLGAPLHSHMCIVHCFFFNASCLLHTRLCIVPLALASLPFCSNVNSVQGCAMCTELLSPLGAFCTRLLLHSCLLHVGSIVHYVHFPTGSASCYTHTFAFCILLFCICTVFVFISQHKCTAVPWGAPLVTRRTFAAESPHFTSHFPSSLHLTFITSLRSIRRWSVYSENNHFPASSRRVDFLPCT